MVRSLTPVLQREFENLRKDADSRRSAMKAIKSYVKDLDSKSIPVFLAQVSHSKETGAFNGECTISLYEVLARVHGVRIVPLIPNIMSTIINTLASSAGSFPLQQACSKVVPAIARYGIDPTTPEEKKRRIVHSLCNPLADSLLGSQDSLTSGAALCLKALVDSDNWRFASDEMVNKVCQNVSGALEEKSTQSNAHMGLVMSLAKRNAIIVEPYARLLLHAGLQILSNGLSEGNSQKRLEAIQMLNFLMKCLDPWSILSELELVIEEMDKTHSDQMPYVAGAAFEALQTAKRIAADKGPKAEISHSGSGSNFSRKDYSSRRRNLSSPGCQSPSSVSPESQTLDSFSGHDSWVESPIGAGQVSQNSRYDCRSVNRKLWSQQRGGVDVSLKDGFFSGIACENGYPNAHSDSGYNQFMSNNNGGVEEFSGFHQRNPRNGVSGSATSSPLRSRPSLIDVDDIIFKTPRKLVHSLQDPSSVHSDFSEKQTRRFRSASFSENCSPNVSRFNRNGYSHDGNGSFCDGCGEQFQGGSESVSSTDGIPDEGDLPVFQDAVNEIKSEVQDSGISRKPLRKAAVKVLCGLSFAVLAAMVLITNQGSSHESYYLVPT